METAAGLIYGLLQVSISFRANQQYRGLVVPVSVGHADGRLEARKSSDLLCDYWCPINASGVPGFPSGSSDC